MRAGRLILHYVTDSQRHDRAEGDLNPRIVDAFALFIARDVKRALEATAAQAAADAAAGIRSST